MGKNYIRKFCRVKARWGAFGLKISTFPRLLIGPIRVALSHLLWPSLLVAGMRHKRTQKVGIGLVVKLQTMQQLNHFSNLF